MDTFLVINFLATTYMTGLIWFVQLVHYPMFASVPPASFPDFELEHARRTSRAVVLPMLVELGSAIALVFWAETSASRLYSWVGLGLVVLVWLSTFTLQVPCHAALSKGYDPAVAKRLVRTNWIRTVIWTLRALMLAACLCARS